MTACSAKLVLSRQEFLAVMIPSMMPPPAPWKMFIFASGVFEMRIPVFLLAVFAGRMLRWLALSLLVLKLGPGAVDLVAVLPARPAAAGSRLVALAKQSVVVVGGGMHSGSGASRRGRERRSSILIVEAKPTADTVTRCGWCLHALRTDPDV